MRSLLLSLLFPRQRLLMSVDIGIGDGESSCPLPEEPSLWLTSDGYYWFLHPLFEDLHRETGQYIDLYGDAIFVGESLSALEQMLLNARKLVEAHPTSWDVHVGTQLSPEHKELHEVVHQDQFVELLTRWERVVV